MKWKEWALLLGLMAGGTAGLGYTLANPTPDPFGTVGIYETQQRMEEAGSEPTSG